MKARIQRLFRMGSRTDGFIIVAVLWILSALATLVMIFSVYVVNAASAFAVHDERLQAEELARAALELAVYQVAADPQAPPVHGTFVFRIGSAAVNAEFTAENARVDLNKAPKELLAGLFAGLGASRDQADFYADRIVGWRTSAADDNPASEAANYRTAGLPYGPRGAPFQHLGELSLVFEIPDFMVQHALPYLTVYSGQAQINVYAAAPQVLAALPGMSPAQLNAILVQRRVPTQNDQAKQDFLASLGPMQAYVNGQASKSVRVTANIAFDSGQRVTTEAVVFALDSGNDPYRVLSWRTDMDGSGIATR